MRVAIMVPSPTRDPLKYFKILEVDPAAIPFFNRAVLSLGDSMVVLKVDKTCATIDQDVVDGEGSALVFMAEIEDLPSGEEDRAAIDKEFRDDDDWGGQEF